MKKVLFLTHFFPPETGAAPVRMKYFFDEIKGAAYQIRVLRPTPNYPLNRKIESSYNDPSVQTIPIYIPQKDSLLKRFFSYATFFINALFVGLFTKFNPDVIVTSSPPLFTAFAAALMAKYRGVKLIFDIRDIWPDIGVELGILKKGLSLNILKSIEKFILNTADKIIVTAQGDKKNIIGKGIRQDKIEIIYNGADTNLFKPLNELEILSIKETYDFPKNKPLLVYFGSYNYGMNDIEILQKILIKLNEKIDYHYISIGTGNSLNDLIENIEGKVSFSSFPALPSMEISKIVAACDLSIIPRKYIEKDTGGNIPVKCFESWACGTPVVLSTIDNCELAEIFDKCNAGIRVKPGDVNLFVEAVIQLLNSNELSNLGMIGRKFVEENFDRKKQSEKIVEIIEELSNEK